MQAEAEESLATGEYRSILVGILLLGALLRWWHVTEQCLTHDEVFEIQAVGQAFSEFFWSPDGFPPLHRMLLWWGWEWWNVESVGRWLAWVTGVVTLIGVYGIGKAVGGRRAGVGATAWAAISPLLIYYSQECRAYGLYLAFGSLAIWAFAIAWRDDRPSAWAALFFTAVCGELTHYYFALLVLIFGILWIVERLRSGRWYRGVVMFSILGLFQLCMYPLLREDLRETIGYPEQTAFGILELGYTLYSFLGGYCLGPSQASLHQIDAPTAVLGFLPYMLALAACLGLPLWRGATELYRRRWLWFILGLVIVPVLLAGALARTMNLNYNVRYVVFAALPISVALGYGWVEIRSNLLRGVVYTAMLGLCLWGLVQRNCVAEYRNEDMRSAATLIRDAGEAAETRVLINVGYMSRPLEYYLGTEWDAIQVPQDGNQNGVVASQDDVDRVFSYADDKGRRHVWAVLSRSFHGDPAGLLRQGLLSRYGDDAIVEFDGVTVVKMK